MAPTKQQYFKFKGIKVPKNTRKTPFIPEVENFVSDALDEKNIKALMGMINKNEASLLVGPTGCGKTTTVKWLAEQTNNSYRRIQLTGGTGVDNLVGKTLINSQGTYWEDGILSEAMRNGYWVLLDEINAALPEVLFVINSILDGDKELILDEKGRERIKAHPDFRLFAAMNPWEDYAGTKELNRALKDRFVITEFEYAIPKVEEEIVSKQSGVDMELGKLNSGDKGVIERMVEFAIVLRKMNEQQEIVHVCSTRQLIQWAELCEYLSIKDAAQFAILNKADKDERKKLGDELNKFFRNDETLDKHVKALKVKKKKEAEAEVNVISDMASVLASSVPTGISGMPTLDIEDEEVSTEVPF